MLCKAAYCTKVFLLVEDLFVLKYRISHCRLIDRLYFSSHWNTMVLVCHKKESISFFISLCLPILYKIFKNLYKSTCISLHLLFVCFSVIYSYNDDISKHFFKSFWELQIDQWYKIYAISLLKSNQFNSACINIPYENSIFRYLLVFPFE